MTHPFELRLPDAILLECMTEPGNYATDENADRIAGILAVLPRPARLVFDLPMDGPEVWEIRDVGILIQKLVVRLGAVRLARLIEMPKFWLDIAIYWWEVADNEASNEEP